LTGNKEIQKRVCSANLKGRLTQKQILVAPGVYDALSALIAQQAGFESVFLSGSAVAYTQLARPDVGLITMTEMAQSLEKIHDRVTIPICVDADSGFGNALNTQRTVRCFERAGASCIQIEDQRCVKRPTEVTRRPLISTSSMVGKIKAAVDARLNSNTLISARTDAFFTLGAEAAFERAAAYAEAGADMIFVEGLVDPDDMCTLAKQYAGKTPLLYNALNPASASTMELEHMGYSMVLYPASVINAAATACQNALFELAGKSLHPATQTNRPEQGIATIIETEAYLSSKAKYDRGQ
tara:strand:+ start:677 stop:1567 length:891 start_codon:yes stop_codon:yes gene_type:complete